MGSLHDYLLGQTQHKLNSIESKLDALTEKVDEALSWAQRLVLLGLSILGMMGLNYSPDKLGEALTAALKALR